MNICMPRRGFALVNVTKLVANIVRTPLANVFLVTRLANNCRLFVPLVVIYVSSLLAVDVFRDRDVCTLHLTERNGLLARRVSHTTLALVDVRDLIRGSCRPVGRSLPVRGLIDRVDQDGGGFLPILSRTNILLKIVSVAGVHRVVFQARLCGRFGMGRLVLRPSTMVDRGREVSRIVRGFSGASTTRLPMMSVGNILGNCVDHAGICRMCQRVITSVSTRWWCWW